MSTQTFFFTKLSFSSRFVMSFRGVGFFFLRMYCTLTKNRAKFHHFRVTLTITLVCLAIFSEFQKKMLSVFFVGFVWKGYKNQFKSDREQKITQNISNCFFCSSRIKTIDLRTIISRTTWKLLRDDDLYRAAKFGSVWDSNSGRRSR